MKKFALISLIALSLAGCPNIVFGATGAVFDSSPSDGLFVPITGFDESFDSKDIEINSIFGSRKKKDGKFVSDEEKYEAENENDDGLFESGDVHSFFYRSALTSDPRTAQMSQKENVVYDSDSLPWFKRTRIKTMNFFRKQEYNSYLKDLEAEQKQLQEFEDELKKEQDENNIFFTSYEKKKANKRKEKVKDEEKIVEDVQFEDESVAEATEVKKAEPIKLKGKLKEVKGENLLVLDADNLYYVKPEETIYAENHAVAKFPKQKTVVHADKFIYHRLANIGIAVGHVKISREGNDLFCDEVQVNINEEEVSFEKLDADLHGFIVNANNGISKKNTVYLYDGSMTSNTPARAVLNSSRIKYVDPDRLIPNVAEEDKFYLQPYLVKEKNMTFDADKVIIKPTKDHDAVTLKNLSMKFGDKRIFKVPSLTAYMSKDHSSFEGSYPEFGTLSRLGMFIGPGFAFEVPRAGVAKFIPFLNYRGSKLGVGGALRYHSQHNFTEVAYGSSESIWILKGHQKLDDRLELNYGINHFKDEWFLGPRMAKYALELAYRDGTVVPNTIAKNLNLHFAQMGTFGYYHNSMYNMNNESFSGNNIGTLRLRYMAQTAQELFKYKNPAKKQMVALSAILQGSAALYGTGDTQFIGRAGLSATTQWKYWKQDVAYFLTTWDGQTPMERFDAYRYGRSSVSIREAIRLCKFLTVAWVGNINVSDDAPNGKMFQENAFIAVLGSEDLKLSFGYDFIRQRTYLTIGASLLTKGTKLNYRTMEIKNPDLLANNDNEKIEELQPEFWLIQKFTPKPKPLQYAQVIPINENDNRERID